MIILSQSIDIVNCYCFEHLVLKIFYLLSSSLCIYQAISFCILYKGNKVHQIYFGYSQFIKLLLLKRILMSMKKISGYTIFLDKCLGSGSYGQVYLGERESDKSTCAIKIMEKSRIDDDEYLHDALFAEMKILQNLRGENIVVFYEMLESNTHYYIAQQLCDKDLDHYMTENPNLTEAQAIKIITDVCNGFLNIVKEGIIHRDIKPANIFMSNGKAKIGDFGFAKKNISYNMMNKSSVGTPLYMSLQLLKNQKYTSKCDIWAMGLIFYQLLHNGKMPWTAQTQFMLVKNISTKPLVINPNLNAKTKSFLEKCLEKQEKNRISWDQIFGHSIFNGYFNKYAQEKTGFQNKLKMIMNELRFQISSNNLNIEQFLKNMKVLTADQLNYQQFCQMLRQLHPQITKDQINFCFEAIDINYNGSISVQQLLDVMSKHGISLNNAHKQDLAAKQEHKQESFDFKVNKTEYFKKIEKSFRKLHKSLNRKKNNNLFDIYTGYDTDRSGQLSLEEFKLMMKCLDGRFQVAEIEELFKFIDTDGSQSLSFQEFYKYYCKINEIPQGKNLREQSNTNNDKHEYQQPEYNQKKNAVRGGNEDQTMEYEREQRDELD